MEDTVTSRMRQGSCWYVTHYNPLPHPGGDGQRVPRRWSIDLVTMDVVDHCFVQEGTITQSLEEVIQLSQNIDKDDFDNTKKHTGDVSFEDVL